MGRRILFLGPQGSGKGTQAGLLSGLLGVPHVSTGEMLREAVAAGTELGRKAEAIMTAGDLVPDDLVVSLVAERLSADDARCGYLLDGFPRNEAQARALDAAMDGDALDTVVLLEAPEEELTARMLKRAADQGRTDDTPEAIARRLAVYATETAPLASYYPGASVPVVRVDAVGTIDEVFSRLALALAGDGR